MGKYEFPKRLADSRADADMVQGDLAKHLGISGGAVSRYEKGTNKMNTEQLYTTCLVLRKSADYLLGLDDRDLLCLDGLDDEEKVLVKDMVDKFRRGKK